jgi:hypothetical protein
MILGALAAVLAGCAAGGARAPAASQGAGVFKPRNFRADNFIPLSVRRVVLLPVHGGALVPPEACEYLDPIFATALERQARFEVVTLSREDCAKGFGAPDLSSTDVLPPDFLARLGTEYGAQAVLFVDVTAYGPYRPLTLGLRAKLATVGDRRLIWTFDEVFTCLDPAVVAGLRRYYSKGSQEGAPVDLSADALVSPRRFAAYAADATFQTLPLR